MTEILAMATVLVGITSGVIEAFKKATVINKKYLPLIAILIGAVLGGGAYFLDAEIGLRMWAGAVSGLAATGLFELGKNAKGDNK